MHDPGEEFEGRTKPAAVGWSGQTPQTAACAAWGGHRPPLWCAPSSLLGPVGAQPISSWAGGARSKPGRRAPSLLQMSSATRTRTGTFHTSQPVTPLVGFGFLLWHRWGGQKRGAKLGLAVRTDPPSLFTAPVPRGRAASLGLTPSLGARWSSGCLSLQQGRHRWGWLYHLPSSDLGSVHLFGGQFPI